MVDIDLVITILSFLAIGYGVMVISQKGAGNFLGCGVVVLGGLFAYNQKSFIPIAIGFALMWVFKLIGFEEGK